MQTRATAVINDTVELEYRVYIGDELTDITAWTKVEIFAVDPREFPAALPVQTILPVDITRVSKGVYRYTMNAVTVARTYFDKQSYQLDIGGVLTAFTDVEVVVVGDVSSIVPPLYERNGHTFDNYVQPADEWGEVLTADDLRYTELFGNTLKGTDGWECSDAQLRAMVRWAVERTELELDIDIVKRIYKTEPEYGAKLVPLETPLRQVPTLNKKGVKLADVDYTDEDSRYEFNPNDWNQYGFVQMRHHPILSVERVEMYSPLNQWLMDITSWARIDKKGGQLHLYPTMNGLNFAPLYGQSPFWSYMRTVRYPQAYRIDYSTGFKSAIFVPDRIRDIVARIACIGLLQWVGDGLLAGFSSSSISLDGISESFSSTQSATSAYFGARIASLTSEVKELLKENRHKFSNIPISFA